jgi:hypothetical protein
MTLGRAWRLAGCAPIAIAALVVTAGCDESLFGRRVDPAAGVDGGVPERCGSNCVADAARDFTAAGAGWRFVNDQRNHRWLAMAAQGAARIGEGANRAELCADNPDAAACVGHADALLITSGGAGSLSDPAVEYDVATNRVLELAVRVAVPPSSGEHRVRIYRNSREDALFTAIAGPGATVAQTVRLDGIAHDRLLVALEPTGPSGGAVALSYFVIGPQMGFPAGCALAATMTDDRLQPKGVLDACGPPLSYLNDVNGAVLQTTGAPYAELGNAVYFEHPLHLDGAQTLPAGARTVQLWVRDDAPAAPAAWVFSDVDEATASGLGIRFTQTGALRIEAAVVSSAAPVTYASVGLAVTSGVWHFVRVVHAGGQVALCVDGLSSTTGALAGPTAPRRPPEFGRNGASPDDFNGVLADLRVFIGELPCP